MIVMLTIYIYNSLHRKKIGQNMCSNHIYRLHALNMSLHIFPRHGAAVPPYGVYPPNGQILYATLIRKNDDKPVDLGVSYGYHISRPIHVHVKMVF